MKATHDTCPTCGARKKVRSVQCWTCCNDTKRAAKRTREHVLSLVTVVESGCWEWNGHRDKRGYSHNLQTTGHRWAYLCLVGPIPDGLELDHLCRNPPCVNPEHMEPVTHAENMRRTRVGISPAHCPHGHSDWSTHPGRRRCLACQREYARRVTARRMAQA